MVLIKILQHLGRAAFLPSFFLFPLTLRNRSRRIVDTIDQNLRDATLIIFCFDPEERIRFRLTAKTIVALNETKRLPNRLRRKINDVTDLRGRSECSRWGRQSIGVVKYRIVFTLRRAGLPSAREWRRGPLAPICVIKLQTRISRELRLRSARRAGARIRTSPACCHQTGLWARKTPQRGSL